MRYIDPDLAAVMGPDLRTDLTDVGAARERLRMMRQGLALTDPVPGVVRAEIKIPSRDEDRSIRCLTYWPAGDDRADLPVALVFHGGGFVMGDIDSNESIPNQIAAQLGIGVVSIGYRLAPEHPYPAAVDDAEDVLAWVVAAGVTGTAPRSVVSVGSSAGGCLAAGVVERARRRGIELSAVALECPVLDDRLATPSSQLVGTPLWDKTAAELSWQYYLGDVDRECLGGDAVPMRATELLGWPATFIAVNALDPLRDEGIAFAQRLTERGVHTELRLYPGTFHGSTSSFPSVAISRRARADLIEALGRLLNFPGRV